MHDWNAPSSAFICYPVWIIQTKLNEVTHRRCCVCISEWQRVVLSHESKQLILQCAWKHGNCLSLLCETFLKWPDPSNLAPNSHCSRFVGNTTCKNKHIHFTIRYSLWLTQTISMFHKVTQKWRLPLCYLLCTNRLRLWHLICLSTLQRSIYLHFPTLTS